MFFLERLVLTSVSDEALTEYVVSEQDGKHSGQYNPSASSFSRPGIFSKSSSIVDHFAIYIWNKNQIIIIY